MYQMLEPSSTLVLQVDDYFQESDWAGRDGIESKAVLYYYPTCLIGHVSKAMREYCSLSQENAEENSCYNGLWVLVPQ